MYEVLLHLQRTIIDVKRMSQDLFTISLKTTSKQWMQSFSNSAHEQIYKSVFQQDHVDMKEGDSPYIRRACNLTSTQKI